MTARREAALVTSPLRKVTTVLKMMLPARMFCRSTVTVLGATPRKEMILVLNAVCSEAVKDATV